MPDQVSRRLFEALRLELLYDHDHNQIKCRVTLIGDTIATVKRTADATVLPLRRRDRAGHEPDKQGNRANAPRRQVPSQQVNSESGGSAEDDLAQVCVAPPVGFEPVRPAPEAEQL
jgi:hypothetical protein